MISLLLLSDAQSQTDKSKVNIRQPVWSYKEHIVLLKIYVSIALKESWERISICRKHGSFGFGLIGVECFHKIWDII